MLAETAAALPKVRIVEYFLAPPYGKPPQAVRGPDVSPLCGGYHALTTGHGQMLAVKDWRAFGGLGSC